MLSTAITQQTADGVNAFAGGRRRRLSAYADTMQTTLVSPQGRLYWSETKRFAPQRRRLRHRSITYLPLLLTLTLFGASLMALRAQTDTTKPTPTIGKVGIDFQKAEITPGVWHLYDGVKMTSAAYDLSGEDFKFYFAKGKPGASSLLRATAEGDPAANVQVIGRFRDELQGQAFRVLSDHAVYTPDDSRPGGGKIVFTGHVQLVAESGFLEGPSHSQFESATVLLGQGADYPQIQTGAGHTEFTPAQ